MGCVQDALGLTLEQKLAIVEVRRQFLGRMQAVVRERAALQGALQRPVPVQYGDGAALNAFAETSVALEERLRALAAEEGEAFNLMSYGRAPGEHGRTKQTRQQRVLTIHI